MARLHRRAGLLAWLAIGALALATSSLLSAPVAAAAATLCAIVLGRAALPRLPACDLPQRSDGRSGCLLSMAVAGAMSLLVSQLSRHSGPQLCGLVAAIPVVAMFARMRGTGVAEPLMLQVLRGYPDAWSRGNVPRRWAARAACRAPGMGDRPRLQRLHAAGPHPSTIAHRQAALRRPRHRVRWLGTTLPIHQENEMRFAPRLAEHQRPVGIIRGSDEGPR
jgi:hypothetical protein